MRATYLAAAGLAVGVLGRPEVAAAWHEPSAVPPLTVGALAAHLARSVLQVGWYLDGPPPEGDPIGADAYYGDLEGTAEPDSALNVGVRARADEAAATGAAGVAALAAEALAALRVRLDVEPPDRRLEALGRPLLLDEYLRTRLVEVCVHVDDLGRSVPGLGDPTAQVPWAALDEAIQVLVGAAVVRHGRVAVLRALSRRELDVVDALRVL
ncbi:MAG: maleylpyruvate isomerase N-terminal domain-containing protein [Acidimicrobiales bacterium]|nr:maleylpyruvate isomerase N-terminal domain-containing protein [Acidimicrobiales bacterium]